LFCLAAGLLRDVGQLGDGLASLRPLSGATLIASAPFPTTGLTRQTRQFPALTKKAFQKTPEKVEPADQSQIVGRARVDALRTNPSLAPQ
jgi:hypothetical protein